jgi:hypothetical protein
LDLRHGGPKRAKLPDDIANSSTTFNIAPTQLPELFDAGLQTGMPRCQKGGRHHLPPWLVLISTRRVRCCHRCGR